MASASFRLRGRRGLDAALRQLTKGTARNVIKRALARSAAPLQAEMAARAPTDTGRMRDSIVTSLRRPAGTDDGKVAYRGTLLGGGSREAAAAALRAARRAQKSREAFAAIYVGPTAGGFYGAMQEFGTTHHPARPFARPAFDATVEQMFARIRADLTSEIDKAVARAARKAARQAARSAT